jgi:hypothetical protein
MLYEFQVLYRLSPGPAGEGQIYSIVVRAETSDEAQRLVGAPGVVVVSAGAGTPILPGKRTFNLEETAVYLDVSTTKVRELQAKGLLPRPQRNGHSVFPIEVLDQYLSRAMQLDAWKDNAKGAL